MSREEIARLRAVKGRVSAQQSMGTVDGPGIRYVVFLQGCPLRCGCCHNPETWDPEGGSLTTAGEIFDRIDRCRAYYRQGGVTLSGGEPLLQWEFACALLALCRQAGLHTCLDTSGCGTEQGAKEILALTDLVLLDVKYTNDEDYRRYVGCSLQVPLKFLALAQSMQVPVRLRQVIISGKNDDEENLRRLAAIAAAHSCVCGTELLAFRTLCRTKYEQMGISFPLGEIPDTPDSLVAGLQKTLSRL